MQSIIDSAPHASRYFSDAFNNLRRVVLVGAHQAMYGKIETYSVGGTNADLRQYLACLAHR